MEGQELALHEGLDPHVRMVIKRKRLLLFEEMLTAAGFPGASDLTYHFTKGFPVAGEFPVTSVFPADERIATGTIEDLLANADSIRQRIETSCRSSRDGVLDEALFKKTLDEVEEGWLLGPLSDAPTS